MRLSRTVPSPLSSTPTTAARVGPTTFVGNITQIVDTSNAGQMQTFTYDARGRLLTAQTNTVGQG